MKKESRAKKADIVAIHQVKRKATRFVIIKKNHAGSYERSVLLARFLELHKCWAKFFPVG